MEYGNSQSIVVNTDQHKEETSDGISSYLLRNEFNIRSPFKHRFMVESCIMNDDSSGIAINYFTGICKKPMDILLGAGSKRMLEVPNAGGNSVWSEALSMELLNNMYGAQLERTEMELEYEWQNCKITDYSVKMFGRTIGVSVTRALKFNGIFSEEDAFTLLKKKLEGIE